MEQKFDVEIFNLEKVNGMELRNSIGIKSQTGLQLRKTLCGNLVISRASVSKGKVNVRRY
jgi:hypothetical protein